MHVSEDLMYFFEKSYGTPLGCLEFYCNSNQQHYKGFYKDYKMLEELAEKEGRQWEKKN